MLLQHVMMMIKKKAHKDCAKYVWVANDVTTECDDEQRVEAHKGCTENENVTNDVTPACDDDV